jgi:hypothetical protein
MKDFVAERIACCGEKSFLSVVHIQEDKPTRFFFFMNKIEILIWK